MSRLIWDGARDYQIGVNRGVFYPKDGVGEAWNGLVSVDEQPTLIEGRVRYRDGIKLQSASHEDSFAATVTAYTYPPSFLVRPRVPFGFSYRVMTADSYKIHLVYNALAHMTDRSYGQSDTTPLQFELTTRPEAIFDSKPASHLVVDASAALPTTLAKFEDLIYGIDDYDPQMPSPQQVLDLFDINAIFQIIDNGDGTFTIDGPDEAFQLLDETTFTVKWPVIVYIDEETYKIRNW